MRPIWIFLAFLTAFIWLLTFVHRLEEAEKRAPPSPEVHCRKVVVEDTPCVVCSTKMPGEFSMSCGWNSP